MGNLLSVKNSTLLARQLFSKGTVSDYHQALRAMNWIYLSNPKKAFATLYPKISAFIRGHPLFPENAVDMNLSFMSKL